MDRINETETLDIFAFVELFGHQQLAGRLTTRAFGSATFFQVDVLDSAGNVDFSQILSSQAIFRITPVTKDWCVNFQKTSQRSSPVPYVDIRQTLPDAGQMGWIGEPNDGDF
jgi:hypothetical protein